MGSCSHIYVGIIEDDDSIGRSLGRLLRTAGIQAVTYESAEAYLADDKRPRFDCLVVDIQLSGMSGIELAQRLRLDASTVPVIFNTAHGEPEIRQRALQTGCSAYLLKTDPGEMLLAAVHEAVNSRANPNSP